MNKKPWWRHWIMMVVFCCAIGGMPCVIMYFMLFGDFKQYELRKSEGAPRIDIVQVKKAVEYNPHHLQITELKPLRIIEVNMEDLGEKQKCYLKDWVSGEECVEWVSSAVRQIREKYENQFEIKTEYSGGGAYNKVWLTKATMMFYPKQKKY